MKLKQLVILFLLVLSSIISYGQVTVNKKNTTLCEVLQLIEKQSGYVFLYTDKDLPNIRLSINLRNASIDKMLSEIFNGLPYSFKVVENNILVRKEGQNVASEIMLINSQIMITGKVTDKQGLGLAGSTIRIEGTNQGVVADLDGRFEIVVPSSESFLVFSFLGYAEEKVKADGRTEVNVALNPKTESLGEIVVLVGFGTQKRESLVGSIGNIEIKELKRAASSNLTNAIGGRIPGLITRAGMAVRVELRIGSPMEILTMHNFSYVERLLQMVSSPWY
jgi:hypothetical protein